LKHRRLRRKGGSRSIRRDLRRRLAEERPHSLAHYFRAATLAAAQMAERLDLHHIIKTAERALVEGFEATLVHLWVNDPGSDHLRLSARAGGARETSGSDAGAAYDVATIEQLRAPLLVNRIADATWLDRGFIERERITAVAAYPLTVTEERCGALICFFQTPLHAGTIEALGALARIISLSIRDVRRLEHEREQRAFIGAATDLLETSLDYEATLGTLAWLAVPRLADWCLIDVLEPTGELQQVAVVHSDPAKIERARALRRAFPPQPSDGYGPWQVLRTGRPELRAEISEEALADSAQDPQQLRLRRELGSRSSMLLPLIARDRTLGVISFISAESGRCYGEADLAVAEELAGKAALAVDNARLFNEIQRGRDQLDAILSGVDDGIIAQDPTGRIVYANVGAARARGFSSTQEMLETPLAEVLDRFDLLDEAGNPTSVDALPASMAFRGQRPPARVNHFRVRETGEERWAVLKAAPVFDDSGDVQLVINIFHDITEQKRAEKAERLLAHASSVLSESLDYGTTLVKLAHLAVPSFASLCEVHVASEGGTGGVIETVAITHADPSALEICRDADRRYPPGPADNHGPGRVIRTGEPEFFSDLAPHMLRFGAREREHLEILMQLGLRSLICVPLSARGRTLGAISFFLSRSGDSYSERDLEFAIELGLRAGLAVDNARLYSETKDAVRARDEFLTVASHELKTPLTSMLLAVQSIVRGARTNPATLAPDRLLPKLAIVDRQGHRLAQLINQLLDISRITARRLILDLEELDLAELCRDVVARYANDLRAAGCAMTLHSDTPVHGRWDRSRVDQVITNLLSNAMKFGQGKPIAVTVAAAGAHASLTVRDQGIGIALADQARLFQRFERAVSSRYYGGFGMGLWIARRIAESLGGTIRFESRPSEGSTFTMDLPLSGPPPAVD
jgi:PAS domain S-box-containing protein